MSSGMGYRALREEAGTLEVGRDVVRVSGPDAEVYLQGQTSQDVAKLKPGGWAWTLVLQPQGKLDVFVRVYRAAEDEFLLDSDTGMGAPLVARLTRFKLRTKVDIEELPWRAVAVRGPKAPPPPVGPVDGDGDLVAVPFEWGGISGYDLLGPGPVPPDGLVAVEAADYEAVRVEAGFPVHGRELDERTIPAEAGLVDATVSFTKGCYTGQELVARIDSRGSNVPRHLRGLLLSGPAQPGAKLYRMSLEDGPNGDAVPRDDGGAGEAASSRQTTPGTGGQETAPGPAGGASSPVSPKDLGRLTSVALSPQLGWVALGYVARAVELGSILVTRDEGGEFEARVESLPLA
jgi:tRNA-modifying protein YgfZ